MYVMYVCMYVCCVFMNVCTYGMVCMRGCRLRMYVRFVCTYYALYYEVLCMRVWYVFIAYTYVVCVRMYLSTHVIYVCVLRCVCKCCMYVLYICIYVMYVCKYVCLLCYVRMGVVLCMVRHV